jgi:hypothetical protein
MFLACATVAIALLPLNAHAESISYTVTATASGSLNGTVFSNQLVTITGSADSDTINTVTPSWIFNVVIPHPTLEIGAGPLVSITDQIVAVDNFFGAFGPVAGFGDETNNFFLLGAVNPVFNGYTLNTPVTGSGPATFNAGFTYGTADGNLIIDSVSGNATFTAAAAATPEPSALILVSTGLLSLGAAFRKKLLEANPA